MQDPISTEKITGRETPKDQLTTPP